uniref:Uncharacterized protein n=1 Tax=Siphoviridae sp. ctDEW4 TaxID=2823569 RepID=A0A8S5L7N9_9CAUD|nr:MAG TPA: hypothetical protein [Siphoviridae sp. ctDEW4]DAN42021.1 MAG TPA: hypothetical protein [Caudoviricetes sp.]
MLNQKGESPFLLPATSHRPTIATFREVAKNSVIYCNP